jgi:uncharacterized protein
MTGRMGSLSWPVTARPFIVNVAGIRRSPGARRPEQRRGRIQDLGVTGSNVPPEAEVGIDVVLEVVNGGIVVIGTVTAPWVGECRRCLGEMRGDLVIEVREIYEPRTAGEESASIEAEEETYPLLGDQLDLMPLARDAVLLNLPLAPLCRDDCAGLCPTCGADRNEGPCDCPPGDRDPRWATLDGLRGIDPS